jgi:C-terminal processing protease CtpA/Prc
MGPNFQRDMEREFGPGSKFQQDIQREFGPDSKFQHDMQKLQEDLGKMRYDVNVPDMPEGLIAWKNRTLGVEAESVSSQLASFFGVKEGVLVRSVVQGSPAEKAGVRAGDIITRIGDTNVSRPGDISRVVRQAAAGKVLPVSIVRNKQQMTLNVTVESKSESSGDMAPRHATPHPQHNFVQPAPLVHGRLVAFPGDTL